MYFDKRDVYEAEVKPLLDKIFKICKEQRMNFTFNLTVVANEEGTVVSRGVMGCMDRRVTDPYTRVNLGMSDMSPEEVEMVCLAVDLLRNKEL